MRIILLIIIFLQLTISDLVLSQNSSLFLPGAVNYVSVGDLDVPGDQLTVEALIQYTGASVNVVSKHTNPADVNYLLRIGSFEITTTAGFANFGGVAAAGVNLVQGETYHIAATYNGQFLRYYINGCMTGEMAWSGDMVQNNLATAIGQQSSCECEQFQGYIDEVRIWNVARTQQEIADNMYNLANPTTQVGLQGYYKFDGNYDNVQGNPAWNGAPIGNPQFQTIPEPLPQEMHLSASSSDVLCNGESNGAINMAASGAYEPYEYSLDGVNFGTQNNFANLPAGNYTVFAQPQNNNNCVVSQTLVINDPVPILDNLITDDVTCFGDNDGSASVNPQGGNGPDYLLEWTPSGSNGTLITNLTSGNYQVSIKDSCKTFGEELVVNSHFENGNTGFTTDYNQGLVGSQMGAGSAVVTFDASLYHNGFVGTGVGGSGNFLVVNGSEVANQSVWCQTIPVTPNTYYNFSAEISSLFNVSPAQLEITINGVPLASLMNAPAVSNVWETYEESWFSAGANQAEICITNLNTQANGNDFGLDNISLKECASCELITPFVIDEPDPLNLAFTFQEESCGGANDGEINFQVTGGTPNYQYSIDGGITFQANSQFQNLSGGTYDLVVQDENDCSEQEQLVLTQLPPLSFDIFADDLSCFKSGDGIIEISNINGGAAPYEFSIDDGVTFQQNPEFLNLIADSYDVVIADANGCENSTVVTLAEPDEITFDLISTDVICFGDENGSIQIVGLQGGTGVLETSIDNQNFTSSTMYSDLSSGNYTVTIVDENGCEESSSVLVASPNELTFESDLINLNCNNDDSGEITFQNVAGGVGTYSYSINGGANFQNDPSFINLSAGSFDLLVQDENNCETIETVQLEEPDELILTDQTTDASCNESCDGTLSVQASGGTQPYSFVWDDGTMSSQLNGLCAGEYIVNMSDANGCASELSLSVSAPPLVIADFYFWEEDYTILNPTIDFYNSSSGATIYTWFFGDDLGSSANEDPSFTFPDEPGKHEVQLIAYNDNNCSDTAVATIEILDEIIYYIPNAFTPDGDGFNDGFKPIFTSGFDPQEFQLLIFNRWGEVVFESRNDKVGWDGSYAGKIAPDGTYIWRVEFKETMSDKRHVDEGHVTLLK